VSSRAREQDLGGLVRTRLLLDFSVLKPRMVVVGLLSADRLSQPKREPASRGLRQARRLVRREEGSAVTDLNGTTQHTAAEQSASAAGELVS
jgi:hypothetical protein